MVRLELPTSVKSDLLTFFRMQLGQNLQSSEACNHLAIYLLSVLSLISINEVLSSISMPRYITTSVYPTLIKPTCNVTH